MCVVWCIYVVYYVCVVSTVYVCACVVYVGVHLGVGVVWYVYVVYCVCV